MPNIVFCMICSGQWEKEDGRLQNVLFALSTEGKVYKFIGQGWKELPNEVLQ